MDADEIARARAVVAEAALRTPLVPYDGLHLKLENLQPLGSFKIRGAWYAVRSLPPEERARGVWTASAGNMGQGLAFAARRAGVPCTVLVPETAPATKCDAIERLGARLVAAPFDRWWAALEERAYPGIEGTFIHPCDDDRMITGNATLGAEIMEDLPDVDAVIAPWGGGGLAIGLSYAVRATVWAAEVDTAAPLAASLESGAPRKVERKASFVDGIGGTAVFPRLFELARKRLAGTIVAGINDVRRAVRDLALKAHLVVEGAGAVPVAAARTGKAGTGKIVCVVSGGNIDPETLAAIITRATGVGL